MPPIDPQIPESVHGDDTIAAIATPAGRGGLGIVRISGPQAVSIAETMLRFRGPLEPRRAALARLVDQEERTVDQTVATWFQAPRSYTAEDVVEICCHGSPAVLAFAVERALAAGARLAEPGEFTLRAFKNGRLDLAQAEAVNELIESATVYQARVAMQQVEGALARRLGPIKKQLTDLIALLEAGIDFAEDDVDVAPPQEILGRLAEVLARIRPLADSFEYGKVVRSGVTLAILGRPNVGKSSLFNRLLEHERAIVTPLAGTTRDVISEVAQIDGLPVKLLDTAGIRSTEDVVEAKGVERSWEALADADLVLAVIDLSQPLEAADEELISRAHSSGRAMLVGNKSDLPRRAEIAGDVAAVSAATGMGVDALRRTIRERAAPRPEGGEEVALITNLRQERLLQECLERLKSAETAVVNGVPHEMLLLDLYGALQPLDAITGATTVEDILRNIFSTFCIGK